MKSNGLNFLRAGVFALAAVFAFAFTQPIKSTIGYGAERNALGQVVAWHEVDISNPQNYDCESDPILGCIYEEEDVSSTMLVQGEFLP